MEQPEGGGQIEHYNMRVASIEAIRLVVHMLAIRLVVAGLAQQWAVGYRSRSG